MSLLFDKNQQLDESELVDPLANKAPRSHKDMLIPQGFNPEIGDPATFVEHCERAKTTNNINMAKFYSSDEESDTNKHKSVPRSSRSVRTTIRNVVIKNLDLLLSTWRKQQSHL